MPSMFRLSRLAFFCLLLLPGFAVSAEIIPPLNAPPSGQQWFGVFLGEERVGFAHTTISAVPNGYEVVSDSSTKMTVMGFSREAFSRESYRVNDDLSVQSFVVEQAVEGKAMSLKGEMTAKGVKVAIESGGGRQEKTLKTGGTVYPAPLLNLCPPMQGVAKGKKYRCQMLDIEEVKLKQVTVTAIGTENLPGEGPTLHLRNNLYRLVDNDVWLDPAGRTIRESVRDGLVETRAEKGGIPGGSVFEAAIAKAGWIVDFSQVGIDKIISRPMELKRMAIELSGIPETMSLLSGGRQHAVRVGGGVLFTVETAPGPTTGTMVETGRPGGNGHPESALVATPENEQLLALKNELLGEEKDPVKAMEKLARWVAASVADSAADDRSPLETVKTKKGNCQSHVRLYAALASTAGLPTRIVTGLVYAGGKGFQYHQWAETFAGAWLAVDPTLGQVPVDATHLKLAEGELSPAETAALAAMVGHMKAKVVEEKY